MHDQTDLTLPADPTGARKPPRRIRRRASDAFLEPLNLSLPGTVDDDGFERTLVLVDDLRQAFEPRKVLFSLGYVRIRADRSWRPVLVGVDEQNVDVMLALDLSEPVDGYPVPRLSAARRRTWQDLADCYVDEHPQAMRLRVDYIALPVGGLTGAVPVTLKRGIAWAHRTIRKTRMGAYIAALEAADAQQALMPRPAGTTCPREA